MSRFKDVVSFVHPDGSVPDPRFEQNTLLVARAPDR